MKINGIQNTSFIQGIENKPKIQNDNKVDFGDVLKNALNKVDNDQKHSQQMGQKLMTGEITDVHQVMIASQKANLSLQLTMQVRNKVVEAYQEVMRMQV